MKKIELNAYLNILLLLHSAFMLCVVKPLLKWAVGGRALNSLGNYIVDHGKSWNFVFEFLCEPCKCKSVNSVSLLVKIISPVCYYK